MKVLLDKNIVSKKGFQNWNPFLIKTNINNYYLFIFVKNSSKETMNHVV